MTVVTFPGSSGAPVTGNWTCPSGVTSVLAECIGSGGNGGTASLNGGVSGGSGAEYAAEPTLTVTPGNLYAYSVGSYDTPNNSTFTGDTITVTANAGVSAAANGRTSVAGGTGSTNTTHQNGGASGAGSATVGFGGGGGGGSASATAAGNAGRAGAATGVANGGASRGGLSGAGGVGASAGTAAGTGGGSGGVYGGGGGGGAKDITTRAPADGMSGVVQLTYTARATTKSNFFQLMGM